MVVDSCSEHGELGNIPELLNTTLQFIPPISTSRIEPLDEGIIAVLKSGCKKRMLFRILNNVDAVHAHILKVNILSAMR